METSTRLRMAAIGAAALTLLTLSGTGTAGARTADGPADKPPIVNQDAPREPVPAGFTGWDALFAEQDRLNGVADRITERAETAEGYAGIVVAPENHEVRLYWRGAVPTAVQTAVDQGRQVAPVRVLPAAHTHAQLLQEATRWVEAGQVTGAVPQPDGSGVQLSVAGADTSPDRLQRPSGATAPVAVEGSETFTTAYDRQNDVPSYYGGGRILNKQQGNGCTAGFPVVDRNGNAGYLTASHCGSLWNEFYDGGGVSSQANYMGTLNWYITNRDAAIVNADTTGRIFVGGKTSSSSARVVGVVKTYPGNFVCNSGSTMGQICNIKVTHYGWSGTYSTGQHVKHMIRAKHTTASCAGAKGDSGGPVYSHANYYGDVNAHGIFSAFSKSANCGGATGGSVIVFPRAWDVLLAFEASLLVS
ncbi:hypothetical protein [Streptosporangium longisporum]|uniref:Serine protease n=1 Tax=Streptosporangium longisporum TaxID=46187 RepID=A0ABP6KRD3_9ACTN